MTYNIHTLTDDMCKVTDNMFKVTYNMCSFMYNMHILKGKHWFLLKIQTKQKNNNTILRPYGRLIYVK